MNNSNRREKYSVSVGNNQLVLILNSEILLPEDAPVRVTSAQLEELDYRKLYKAYSSRGRKSVTDPRVLFKVMAYGYQCGIYSSRKLEEACKYRVDFMWLLENGKAPDHSPLSRFRTGRCAEAVEDSLVPQKLAIGGDFGFVLSLSFFQLPHRGVILLQDGSEHGLEFLFPFRHALTQ